MLLRHVIIWQSTVLHNNLAKIRNKNDLGAINSKKWEYDECTWSACASVTKKSLTKKFFSRYVCPQSSNLNNKEGDPLYFLGHPPLNIVLLILRSVNLYNLNLVNFRAE